ncbi:YdeI/OmpD-associated family protein [Marinovum sp. 2_MG-2023]|uniref:YdeI/OmpD-associated family protein n=1 Tax=unclassified Marinovum TaxID=2647166 RepID=UPI0026E18E12|nr:MULTISPECIES: YdeI/OmpD-associated family protein [unclassified Marinovum]MDO6732353.1 YdeI/OmpD-associated family protein [Marinovum sp. 2_MG-2023]MDO6781670.1 YdeI/OmpD-associated family protein [Marinovum sp. 1_MG-2023]
MGNMDRRCGIWFDKATVWRAELLALREILLHGPVDEAFKWRGPVYTAHGGNIAVLWAMKHQCGLGFFKGALLDDPAQILVAPGPNSRATRMIAFTDVATIRAQADVITKYLLKAIENEAAGLRVTFAKDDLDLPEELNAALAADPVLNDAFMALTPGRRRGYILHFAGAKQAKTRAARIEKWTPLILQGKGMHDR